MNLIDKVRDLYKGHMIEEEDIGKFAEYIGKLFECDVLIMDDKGTFLGVYFEQPVICPIISEMLERGMMDVVNVDRLNMLQKGDVSSSCFNPACVHIGKEECTNKGKYILEIPGLLFGRHLGTAIYIRDKRSFSEDEKAVLEMIAITMAFERLYRIEKVKDVELDLENRVKIFVASLSKSEKRALGLLLDEMGTQREKKIIITDIAAKGNITRSIVVTLVKKLVGANLAEASSMGASGTYLKLGDGVEFSFD